MFSSQSESSSPQYIVTDEFVPVKGALSRIFDCLKRLAALAQKEESVLTFWVQDRFGKSEHRTAIIEDESIYILIRCRGKQAWQALHSQTGAAEWKHISGLSENRRTTTWVESGIGFIAR